MGILRPPELGDDEVFLAGDPGEEIFDRDALAALKLGAAIWCVFADDAVHFDDALLIDEVQQGLVRDRTADGLAGNVVVGAEEAHDLVCVLRRERNDEMNPTSHARLRVIVRRHRTGQHVGEAYPFQPGETSRTMSSSFCIWQRLARTRAPPG